MVTHDTLVITRLFEVPVETLYHALTDKEAHCTWFVGPEGWEQTERSYDFRVGGGEVMRGSFGTYVTSYTSLFYDIQPNKSFVYSFDVVLGGKIFSASLATFSLEPAPGGTLLTFTEQLAYIDNEDPKAAHENRRQGTEPQFDRIAAYLGLPHSDEGVAGDACKEGWSRIK